MSTAYHGHLSAFALALSRHQCCPSKRSAAHLKSPVWFSEWFSWQCCRVLRFGLGFRQPHGESSHCSRLIHGPCKYYRCFTHEWFCLSLSPCNQKSQCCWNSHTSKGYAWRFETFVSQLRCHFCTRSKSSSLSCDLLDKRKSRVRAKCYCWFFGTPNPFQNGLRLWLASLTSIELYKSRESKNEGGAMESLSSLNNYLNLSLWPHLSFIDSPFV